MLITRRLIAKSAAGAALLGCSSVQLVPVEPIRGSQALVVSSGIEVRADAREHPANVPTRPRVASLGLDPASPFVIQQHAGGAARAARSQSGLLEPRLGSFATGTAGVERSRREIAQSAFQGGSIGAGETRQGFVYFSSVPKDAERVTLRVGVRPTRSSAPAAVVEIAYAVRS